MVRLFTCHSLALVCFSFPVLLCKFYQGFHGQYHREANRKEVWNVDGVLLVVREVEQREEALVEERGLGEHERVPALGVAAREAAVPQHLAAGADVGEGGVDLR